MTNTTTKSVATARHRKPTDTAIASNAVEAITRWWVITYGPTTSAYYIESPRV
jgi:hypothetical protein